LTLIFTLFVLAAPVAARADYYWYYLWSSDGGNDPGDPDGPGSGKMAPGQRAGRVGGNDGGYVKRQPLSSDSWTRRYQLLLSGLRSYYLRY